MTGAPPPEVPPEGPDREDQREDRLVPTRWTTLVAWAAAGVVLGRVWHPVAERLTGTAPTVSLLQGLVLYFVAAILGGTAWITWRAVHVRRERLDPHRAVNRLVLARACALVGALVAGGYAGYAISWLGSNAELANQRVWRSALAALGGVATATAAVLLERACRVRSDGDAL
ncbi:DUF3180 domain-containing protein [uncultured Nocardioides sp.]|uniref:DUF3180 domain-containing protein n=1 Tax=uncultured Nocardioides sp. TaxID=198441 RepID=UPI0025EB15FC|nr:DUF3180 domain-containing protein [uncultured Nocardioides sp.]